MNAVEKSDDAGFDAVVSGRACGERFEVYLPGYPVTDMRVEYLGSVGRVGSVTSTILSNSSGRIARRPTGRFCSSSRSVTPSRPSIPSVL